MKPNVVFVLTDQWRAQAFGYAGDPNVQTPHIDALAARSINFENAVSVCPVCTPARASLLTGRYPTTTGMFMNDLYLPAEERCMGEIFKDAGYDTAYIGKWHLDGHGRDQYIPPERRQGFDYWKVLECTHDYNESYYYAGDDPTKRLWEGYDAYAQTEDAEAYLRAQAEEEKPFLLFVSFGGPHFPHHTAPEELKARYPVQEIELRPNVPEAVEDQAREEAQGYYGHCTAIDQCVGRLYRTLEETGIAEHTIFVFASDHGEMMGSQGEHPWRKQVPWDESIRVPLLLRYPALGVPAHPVRTPINIPDYLPTLLALADIPIPEPIEGEDLSRLMQPSAGDEDRAALIMAVAPFGTFQVAEKKSYRGIRTARHTYVCYSDGPWLLYDNREDPYQLNNRIADPAYAKVKTELDAELQRQLKRNRDDFPTREAAIERWGYTVNKSGDIPYNGHPEIQTPHGAG